MGSDRDGSTGAVPVITEQERLAVLASYDVLDTDPEPAFDDLVDVASRTLRAPIALLSLVDDSRQFFKARVGMPVQWTQRCDSVCATVAVSGQSLIVPDLSLDARFKGGRLVTGPPHLRFYAGAPLTVAGGATLGSFCILDTAPRTITDEEMTILEALARQAVAQLELRRERRTAELRSAELASLNASMQALLDHSPAPIYIKDGEGRFLVAGRAVSDFFTAGPDGVAGLLQSQVLPAEVSRQILDNDAEVMASGRRQTFTERVPDAVGATHVFVSTKFPLPPLQEGGSALLGGISVDITELDQIRRDLAESRQRYEALVEGSGTAILVLSPGGRVLFANTAGALWREPGVAWGRPLPTVQTRRREEWLRRVLDRRRVGGERIPGAWLGPTAPQLVEVYAAAVSWQGAPAVQVEARDATIKAIQEAELAANEARMREIFELSPTGLGELDAERRITRANGALERLLAATPGSLTGRLLRDFFSPECAQRATEYAAQMAQGTRTQVTTEVELDTLDGRRLHVLLASNVVDGRADGDDAGGHGGAARPGRGTQRGLFQIVDISEQVHTRRALEMARRQLEAAHELSGIGSYFAPGDGNAPQWSTNMTTLLGLPEGVPPSAELWTSLVLAEDLPLLDDVTRSEADGIGPFDVRVRRWDGEVRVFELRGQRLVPGAGAGAAHFGTVRDVTDERDHAARLRDSEASARLMLAAIPDAVVVCDPSGRIVRVNDQTVSLFGWTPDELIGRPVETLVPIARHSAHRAHRARYESTEHPQVMGTGAGIMARRKDGSEVPVEVNLARLDVPSGALVLASVRDVTTARVLQREVTEANALLSGVLEGASEQAIIATDTDGLIEVFNSGGERILGLTRAQAVGTPIGSYCDEDELTRHARDLGLPVRADLILEPARRTGSHTRQWTWRRADGTTTVVSLSVTQRRSASGDLCGFILIGTDVTGQVHAEQARAASEELFRTSFNNAPIGMILVGVHGTETGTLIRANQAMADMLGRTIDDLVGSDILDHVHPDDRDRAATALRQEAEGQLHTWTAERRYVKADGAVIWTQVTSSVMRDAAGNPLHRIGQVQDITQRKQAEAELTHRALHDTLTGLPNRDLLLSHLTRALARCNRAAGKVGLIFLDCDDFKLVNDSLGHGAGDEYLTQLAGRLHDCLREVDLAARLGGDEFVIVTEGIVTTRDLELIARRMERSLTEPMTVGGEALTPSLSMGLVVSEVGSTSETMLADADAAMYEAKRTGKGRWHLAGINRQARARRQLTVEEELRTALENNELCLYYQPVWHLGNGRLIATEALLRWNHPRDGLLGPDAFLDVAEDRDLIAPIGAWVLDRACRQAATWHTAHGPDAPQIWVNISSGQLGRHRLAHVVEDTLRRTRLPRRLLQLELTERQVIGLGSSVRQDLNQLRNVGVGLAIDDFGTGHNGINHLRKLTISTIKIDRSFTANLGVDRTDTALTASVIALGRELDLEVVAEGIETPDQLSYLQGLSCQLGQGYLLDRPAPSDTLDDVIARGTPATLTPTAQTRTAQTPSALATSPPVVE